MCEDMAATSPSFIDEMNDRFLQVVAFYLHRCKGATGSEITTRTSRRHPLFARCGASLLTTTTSLTNYETNSITNRIERLQHCHQWLLEREARHLLVSVYALLQCLWLDG